jgi:uncharacterized membrane protein
MSQHNVLAKSVQVVSTVLLATGFICAQPQYKVMDLGIAGRATDINNRGQIIGSAGSGGSFIWDNGVVTYFTKPGGAQAMNASGAIVGGSYLLENGTLTYLGNLLSAGGAFGINDREQVVGIVSDSVDFRRAFLWEKGQLVYLPTTGLPTSLPFTRARAINNAGEIVGNAFPLDTSFPHAVIWNLSGNLAKTTVTDLNSALGRQLSDARAINSRGQVAGVFWSEMPIIGTDGFIWDRGSVTVLPHLVPNSINARGEVAGRILGLAAAAVWQPKGNGATGDMITLNMPSGTVESEAIAINDAGAVAGWYRLMNGETRVFLAVRQ